MAVRKKKLSDIEFIRTVCALGIVVYHLSCHVEGSFKLFFSYANGQWGDAVVMLFFMMSGSMIYLNNKEVPSLKTFYYKRWKSIFPAFYIGFLAFFMWDVLKYRHFLFREDVNPLSLVLTLFGIDGYFLYAVPSYYILGEWFLGALIMLYALYPALANGVRKRPYITAGIVTALYAWILVYNVFDIKLLRNFFSCLISFYLGILVMKYRDTIKKFPVFIGAAAVMLILAFVKFPVNDNISVKNLIEHVMGLSMYITFIWVGEFITRAKPLKILFEKLGALSYPVFLVQHQIIVRVLAVYSPLGAKDYMLTLAVILAITLASAFLLKLVTDFTVNSGAFKDLENMILGKRKNGNNG
ncbi:MAG: acyltransferase [Ruminococcaceae bacterium]|nr:acyltransferase [Oscillospiraceae bacterium]